MNNSESILDYINDFLDSKLYRALSNPAYYISKHFYSWLRYKDIRMCILGDKYSGKSCLYSFFEGKKNLDKETTSKDRPIKKMTVSSTNEITLTVEEGSDISGAQEMVCRYYKKKVFESDLIIYLVDSRKLYLNKEDYRRYITAQIYLISMLIKEKEVELKNDIERLKGKKRNKDEENELKNKEKALEGGTTLIIVPTWRALIVGSVDSNEIKNILLDQFAKNKFLNETILQNRNAHICDMYELVDHKKGENVLNRVELKALTDEIIATYTANLKRNHKWIL